MRPIQFKGANGTLGGGPAAKYGTDEPVANLPVYRGDGCVVSCWQMSPWERVKFLLSGRVWLFVLGSNHAPISMTSSDPFAGAKRAALDSAGKEGG